MLNVVECSYYNWKFSSIMRNQYYYLKSRENSRKTLKLRTNDWLTMTAKQRKLQNKIIDARNVAILA